jgi:hypothetical protein
MIPLLVLFAMFFLAIPGPFVLRALLRRLGYQPGWIACVVTCAFLVIAVASAAPD